MKSTTKIPEKLKSYYPKNGYHVRMNRNYTATIRSLTDFQDYVNHSDLDMDVFGEITSADKSASDDFKYVLNTIIAEVKGFAVFNAQFKHTYIECTESAETISLKTSTGKLITFSVMFNQCVDVKYHNGKDDFKIIGFHFGQTPVPHTDVTLQTILLDQ